MTRRKSVSNDPIDWRGVWGRQKLRPQNARYQPRTLLVLGVWRGKKGKISPSLPGILLLVQALAVYVFISLFLSLLRYCADSESPTMRRNKTVPW